MRVLDQLEPKRVFSFFEDLCAIPHGSGNTKAISDYCVKFAHDRGLEVHQDSLNNVVIVKPATPGYEAAPTVIVQGHLDMVTEKMPESTINFLTDGLELEVDGDFVRAKGTTLGGDDGIAVAMALTVLDSDDLAHPRLECLFTVDEETGMDGAVGFDASVLEGKRLLNIDSEEEGILTVSCAGGAHAAAHIEMHANECALDSAEIRISGLKGGHSGAEIDKGRANATITLGRVLQALVDEKPYTEDDISKYYDDNADSYAGNGIEKSDVKMVNVRHILIQPEGKNDDGTYTDEAWAEAEKKANDLLTEWQNGEHTEDSFAFMAAENSQDPGSVENGGLYEDIYPGKMVDEFDAWCFDPARQPGDTGIVKTSYGYHIMYFSSTGEHAYWYVRAEEDYLNELSVSVLQEVAAKFEVTESEQNAAIVDIMQQN